MKLQFLLAGALLVGAPVFARAQASAAGPSGYDLLVQADRAISSDPNGRPSDGLELQPEEKLKRQRLAVKHNALALSLVRRALQKPIEIPLLGNYKIIIAGNKIRAEELARRLAQESDVRFADGDFDGAMNSKLDIMELGAAIENGPSTSMVAGLSIEALGRDKMDKIIPHLTAPQCRDAIARLEGIGEKRPSYAEVVQWEKQRMHILMDALPDVQKQLRMDKGRKQAKLDAKQAAQVEALKTEKLRGAVDATYAPFLASAAQPYSRWVQLREAPPSRSFLLLQNSANLFLKNSPYFESAVFFLQINMRWSYERGVVDHLLTQTALELRARQLETGFYPTTLATPTDPFSPDGKPLAYYKTAAGYVLYSVGPDGKDDGGQDIRFFKSKRTDRRYQPSGLVGVDSQGDIVQKPF